MVPRLILLILAACTIVQPIPSHAQSRQKLEDCWPIPTLAQEIKQMHREQRVKNPKPQVRVERLVYNGQLGLASPTLRRISGALKKATRGDADRDWLYELGERVRDA